MNKREAILKEIERRPEDFLGDILEPIRRLKLQAALNRSETAVASEGVLAKDWLGTVEDEAWRGL